MGANTRSKCFKDAIAAMYDPKFKVSSENYEKWFCRLPVLTPALS